MNWDRGNNSFVVYMFEFVYYFGLSSWKDLKLLKFDPFPLVLMS